MFARRVAMGVDVETAHAACGYSANRTNALALRRRPEVHARIAELERAGAERAEITVARVVEELAKIAFADIAEYGEWTNSEFVLKNTEDLSPDLTAAIAQVRTSDKGVALKMHDKLAALDKLGKYLGMSDEGVDNTRPGDINVAAVNILVQKLTG